MKVLVIGSGGREHAVAWKIRQSKRVTEVLVAPGNGGTRQNIAVDGSDIAALCNLAVTNDVDLTIVGPEIPLSAGVVDEFQAHGLKIWGPSRAAAQIEANKAYAKAFMERHNIPTGAYAAFTNFDQARSYLLEQKEPVVIKASGLAAGKGVILPGSIAEAEDALRRLMIDGQFGEASREVLIEERLTGPEVSVLAFCDGKTPLLMPPAQDHKRAFDNDTGPNTGGMGAYAPAPICPTSLLEQINDTVLQPALDGLSAEGIPYIGVLYAGMMLSPDGPKVIEFNCRFGDPETQVLLPLLQTDLLEIIERCLAGTLAGLSIDWSTESAATVVLASGGYPGLYDTGKSINGLDRAAALDGVMVFHAGTRLVDSGTILTAGGRVLNVTGIGSELQQALDRAYTAVKTIYFPNMHYRTDIGARAIGRN